MATPQPTACLLVLALAACPGGDSPGDSATEPGTTGGDGPTTTSPGTDTDAPTTTGVDGFGPEREFVLRLNDDPAPPLKLSLNKADAAALFGATAGEIKLLDIESGTLLKNTLDTIKSACGTGWKADDADPKHDCSGTDFKGPDNTWKTSAEYSLIRILTMTPANARVAGTSIAGMQGLADGLGIGGGFSQMLSETLGIQRTEEFITTPELVVALQRNLLATHPHIGGDGKSLPLYLDDALQDLTTLATKLGPTGDHPGIVDPSFPITSECLTPEFAMNIEAESNLRLLDGIDLSEGKDYMSTVVDVAGPTFGDPLEFDFNDPAKFSIVGVADAPRVDLRFAISEHDDFINSCAGDPACKQNLPENVDLVKATWPGSAWAIDPWLLESVIVAGGREKYKNRIFDKCYEVLFSCNLGAHVYVGPDPPGWALFDIFLNLGNPPKDQYVWELINEVAQIALHTPPNIAIPEGSADVAFTLRDIDIGVTGPQIAESVRPYLQAQAPKIADLLLGDYWKNNGPVDFYYRRGGDGLPYLFYVAPDDLPPNAEYKHPNPGFFTCPEVQPSCKASATELAGAGDDIREKVRLDAGETVLYVQDDAGVLYRARFLVPEGDAKEITVRVAAFE
ncbi:hypothetical protein [Nannocystis bainbridge]|uniref:Lipoprotein n=1 Tax=Nannocystis bainbridge TaxID=2995303 RepID=A0ABT5DTI9_9BACT|nr:hypothetical protein [Nannocystis bainbridge]MDC0716043.1 hypothetical protein [Nannocystis bainbridge]